MVAARAAFRVVAWALAVGVVAQVFLAGMALFASGAWWDTHRTFVQLLEPLPIVLFVVSFPAGFGGRLRWGAAGAFGLIALQYALVAVGPPAAALHPVNAFALLFLAVALAHWARLDRVRAGSDVVPVPS